MLSKTAQHSQTRAAPRRSQNRLASKRNKLTDRSPAHLSRCLPQNPIQFNDIGANQKITAFEVCRLINSHFQREMSPWSSASWAVTKMWKLNCQKCSKTKWKNRIVSRRLGLTQKPNDRKIMRATFRNNCLRSSVNINQSIMHMVAVGSFSVRDAHYDFSQRVNVDRWKKNISIVPPTAFLRSHFWPSHRTEMARNISNK